MIPRIPVNTKNKHIIKMWTFVYKKWLPNSKVIEVRGWRTALIEQKYKNFNGRRMQITPCFWWLD